MSTSKTYAVAIAFRGHPYGFVVDANTDNEAKIDALVALALYLDEACALEDNDGQIIAGIIAKARSLSDGDDLNAMIQEEDYSWALVLGHAEEVVSLWRHGFECGKLRDGQHSLMRERNHWRDRAFQMLNAAKKYNWKYLHACEHWDELREQYNEMQDYYDAMQREGREQLAKARILQIGFLAAGVGLGLVIHHLIF